MGLEVLRIDFKNKYIKIKILQMKTSTSEFDALLSSKLQEAAPSRGPPNRRHLTYEEKQIFLKRLKDCQVSTSNPIKTPVILSPDKSARDTCTSSLFKFIEGILDELMIPVNNAELFLEEYTSVVCEAFLRGKIASGANVGTIAVEAFANPISQGNFNTFHLAGFSKNSSQGISAFEELFTASKSKKTYSASIKFIKRLTSDEILIDKYREFVSIYASNVMSSIDVISVQTEMFTDGVERKIPNWYENYKRIYRELIPSHIWKSLDNSLSGKSLDISHILYIRLNLTIMYKSKISVRDIIKKVTKYKDCYAIYSPPMKASDDSFIELYLIPDITVIKGVKAMEKIDINIGNSDLELLYLYNTKISELSVCLIKGVINIDNIGVFNIPIINSIYQATEIKEILTESEIRDIPGLDGDMMLIKYNKKYMISNSITEEDVIGLLSLLKVDILRDFGTIISKNLKLRSGGYDIIVKYNKLNNLAVIKKKLGDLKDKVPYVTIQDLLKYKLGIIEDNKKIYIALRRILRKKNMDNPENISDWIESGQVVESMSTDTHRIYAIKINAKFDVKTLVSILSVIGFRSIDAYENILRQSSELFGYNILLEYDKRKNIDNILDVLGTNKDPVDYLTVDDISNYLLLLLKNGKKVESGEVLLYPKETMLETYSVIRMCETAGIKREKTSTEVTKKGKSTLLKVFDKEDVDPYGTTSDDIYEMSEIFGIECFRQVIRRMFIDLIKISDFVINTRHVDTVCDFMSRSGFITSISEKGMGYHHMGPTAQFAYTKPSKYIKKAGLYNVDDTLDNASSRITVGRRIKSGTSVMDIVPDPRREAILLKEMRDKKLIFSRSQTSTLISQLLSLSGDDTEESSGESRVVLLSKPTVASVEVITPDIQILSPISEDLEPSISIPDLDPVYSRELVEVTANLDVRPIICTPSMDSEKITVTGMTSDSTTEPIVSLPYIPTTIDIPLAVTTPSSLSITYAQNEDLSQYF